MTTTRPAHPAATTATEIPAVPLTVEGYSVLHQMMRFRWSAWRVLPDAERSEIINEAVPVMKVRVRQAINRNSRCFTEYSFGRQHDRGIRAAEVLQQPKIFEGLGVLQEWKMSRFKKQFLCTVGDPARE